jgi:hypothetical protein
VIDADARRVAEAVRPADVGNDSLGKGALDELGAAAVLRADTASSAEGGCGTEFLSAADVSRTKEGWSEV